jgi:predicted phosphoribosyltransferase
MLRSVPGNGPRFRDRRDAGKLLAQKLAHDTGRCDAVVLALPRGGVPVAYEVALALDLPLDVFSVRKLGVPGQEELAMGAIGSGGVYYLNDAVLRSLHVSADQIRSVVAAEQRELERREHLYHDNRPRPAIAGNLAFLVDDGLATGASMFAAIGALRRRDPARIVVAVPVGPADTIDDLQGEVDEVVCCLTPSPFAAVGFWYDDFSQTTDQEVRLLLDRAATRR